MALHEAIDCYHGLLDDALAGESMEQLASQLERRGLFFGKSPLCRVLRPRFLTPEQYRFLQDRVEILLSAFRTAHRAAMEAPGVRGQLRLQGWEEELISSDPGFREPAPVSRVDAFFVHGRGGFRVTEYNAETPAAAAYNDVLAAVFFGLPVMRRFLRRYEVRPQPARHNVLHSLIEAYQEWRGGTGRPRIAILDWKEVPTYSEFVISAEYFRSQGFECVIADPREAEYDGSRLRVKGEPVDLVYKRVLISELVERCGLDHALVRAVRDRAVCMVNPFRCKLLHKKASLAVLGDERNRELFGAREREAIDAHVPWTRVVEERRTIYRGEEVDLLPFVAENRERFALKPNDAYGGSGIVLGWEADDEAWRRSLQTALDGDPFVVQERVELPMETFPLVADGRLRFEERIVDTAPFCFHGEYMDGCLTRLSTESLVNVTAGGGSSLATFVVAPR